MGDDEAAWDDALFFRVIADGEDPTDLLAEIVALLESTEEPDLELIGSVGAGALETLVRNHGVELWDEIERFARQDVRFRRALRSVWAYESPEYERRTELLGELREWWPIEVRFVVEPADLSGGPRVWWRAREVRGQIEPVELARVLREIADHVERPVAPAEEREEDEAPAETVEALADRISEYYRADHVEVVRAPDREDRCLLLFSLPEGRVMQAIGVGRDGEGWVRMTLRPAGWWLPYEEPPASEQGVLTEPDLGADGWTPATSDGVSRTTLGTTAYVSYWGVGRDEGRERSRSLRRVERS